MGCDCGKRMVSKAEQRDCEESAKLEAPDQVFNFNAQTRWLWNTKNPWQRDKDKEREDTRIVGGCAAGHTPWFVYLRITGGFLIYLSNYISHQNMLVIKCLEIDILLLMDDTWIDYMDCNDTYHNISL